MGKIYKLKKYDETYKIQIRKSEYTNNGTLALIMLYYDIEDKEWWIWSDLTVNIEASDFMASSTKAFIDTNDNGQEIISWLEKNGLGHATGQTARNNYCEYPLFEFKQEVLDEIEEY